MKWNSKNLSKYKRGDLLLIKWNDIVGSPTGNVKDANPAVSVTSGFFYGYKIVKGKRYLQTVLTVYPLEPLETMGHDTYACSIIEDVINLGNYNEHFNHQETPPHDTSPQSQVRPLPDEAMPGS